MEKYTNDVDGKDDTLDMDITSESQSNYNQFSSSQRRAHLNDISTFIFMTIFMQEVKSWEWGCQFIHIW